MVAIDNSSAIENLPLLDAVADTVAGKTGEVLIAKVKTGGTFATVLDAPANAKDYPKVKVVLVQPKPDPAILLYMADAVRRGKLVIPIGRRLPMAEAAKAHEAIVAGSAHGKVLLVNERLAQSTTDAMEAVKSLLAAYNDALNESKTDAILALYAKNGVFMAPFSPSSTGLKAIRSAYDDVFVTRKFNVVFHLVELVILAPTWAYARTNSAGHTTNPVTETQSSEGNQELFLFHKELDGAWKIYRYSFSPTTPPT